jgi:hypothetical protein
MPGLPLSVRTLKLLWLCVVTAARDLLPSARSEPSDLPPYLPIDPGPSSDPAALGREASGLEQAVRVQDVLEVCYLAAHGG